MQKKIFWFLVIGIHCCFLLLQLLGQTTILQDTKEYLFAADNLIHAGQLYAWDLNETLNYDYFTKRPILFPSILAFFKLLSFGNFKVFLCLLLIVQNFISLLNIHFLLKFVFHFTKKINYNLAFALLILTPAQVIYANLIMSEIWLQLVIMLLLNYFLFHRQNSKWHLIAALLCIAGIALKPVFVFWIILFPLLIFYFNRKTLNIQIIGIGLLPAIYLFIAFQWNENRTGAYQYSSISTINLLHYNAYTVLIHEKGVAQADSIIDKITFNANLLKTYGEQQTYKEKAAKMIINANLGTYLYLHLRGQLVCLLDPGRFDITQFFNLPHRQNLLYESHQKNNQYSIIKSFLNPLGLFLIGLLLVNCIKLVLAFRFLFKKGLQGYYKFLLLIFPVYLIALTGPLGSSRFAMPILPIYCTIVLISLSTIKPESRA